MSFVPTADKLIPDLTPQQELVILARALWREGYNDHLAGHITIARGDGTYWCNAWLLHWEELRPEHVIAIDIDGNVVEGDWPVPLGIPLHLALHRTRPGVKVAMHSHPLYATVWADARQVPPVLDQSSALGGGGELKLVSEYDGAVNDMGSAQSAVDAIGDADLALLAGHGVFVLGNSVRAVHQRAVALEQRAHRALLARLLDPEVATSLPASFLDKMGQSQGDGFIGFWEAAVRTELRADPTLLD